MHILIGLVTAIGGLIWAIYRLQQSGVNLNDFNPFYWMRRREWAQRVGAKPLHSLDRPMQAAACLIIGVARMEGEISREQKLEILRLFEQEFKLSSMQAQELFASSSFLLKDVMNLRADVKDILAPSIELFTAETRASLLGMLNKVATMDSSMSDDQQALIDAVEQALRGPDATSQW